MKSSKSVRPSEIYQSWLSGTNGCEGCERRDEDRVTTPYFGFGEFPTEVLFLGEAPGGTKTGSDNNLETDKRVWKNHREVASEAGKMDPATASDFNPKLTGLSDSHYNQLEPFFDSVSRELGEIDRPQSIYYTNVAKCNDLWKRTGEDRRDDLNSSGKQQCLDAHLLSEIRGADPSVIVMFSKGTALLKSSTGDMFLEPC